MKRLIFALLLLPSIALADTNVLQLVWTQPPGYSSQLFTTTNLAGTWSPLTNSAPPVTLQATQQVAFFYVSVTPNTRLAGVGMPTADALAGSTYVETNNGNIWFNITGGTNGWVWEIAGQ